MDKPCQKSQGLKSGKVAEASIRIVDLPERREAFQLGQQRKYSARCAKDSVKGIKKGPYRAFSFG
jgi:hypothetical protein